MRNYSGDGLFWWATKKKCKNLDPYKLHFEDRKKSCTKKGYEIRLNTDGGTEYHFVTSDEEAISNNPDLYIQSGTSENKFSLGPAQRLPTQQLFPSQQPFLDLEAVAMIEEQIQEESDGKLNAILMVLGIGLVSGVGYALYKNISSVGE